MSIHRPLNNTTGLDKLDTRAGLTIIDPISTIPEHTYPFEASTAAALEKLQGYLRDDSREVTPVFELTSDRKAKLVSLSTGPDLRDVNAVNRLNTLLPHGLAKQQPTHDFDKNQNTSNYN